MTHRIDGAAIAVLANAQAGRGRHHRLLEGVLARLGEAGRRVRLLEADTGERAEQVCQAAVADGVCALVAVGGDGTCHRALQAVAGTGVPLGIVPAGTGNDLAAAVGVPADPLAAASAAAAALAAGAVRAVDLAQVTTGGRTRWFGGVLAAGFDAVVNERANRMRRPRGPRRYDLAVVAELARLRPRRYALRLDGQRLDLDAVLVAVGNIPSYGGGMRICPDADPTDGLLDVVIGAAMSRRTLIGLKPKVRTGAHLAHPLVTAYRAATVQIDAEGITAYADGERIGPLPVSISCVPGALRLLQRGLSPAS